MAKRRAIPGDSLFRRTDVPQEDGSVDMSQSKQGDMSTLSGAQERQRSQPTAATAQRSTQDASAARSAADAGETAKTTVTPRQTYYVPEVLHRQLKILAIQRKRNVSDLVVEGIEHVLREYEG